MDSIRYLKSQTELSIGTVFDDKPDDVAVWTKDRVSLYFSFHHRNNLQARKAIATEIIGVVRDFSESDLHLFVSEFLKITGNEPSKIANILDLFQGEQSTLLCVFFSLRGNNETIVRDAISFIALKTLIVLIMEVGGSILSHMETPTLETYLITYVMQDVTPFFSPPILQILFVLFERGSRTAESIFLRVLSKNPDEWSENIISPKKLYPMIDRSSLYREEKEVLYKILRPSENDRFFWDGICFGRTMTILGVFYKDAARLERFSRFVQAVHSLSTFKVNEEMVKSIPDRIKSRNRAEHSSKLIQQVQDEMLVRGQETNYRIAKRFCHIQPIERLAATNVRESADLVMQILAKKVADRFYLKLSRNGMVGHAMAFFANPPCFCDPNMVDENGCAMLQLFETEDHLVEALEERIDKKYSRFTNVEVIAYSQQEKTEEEWENLINGFIQIVPSIRSTLLQSLAKELGDQLSIRELLTNNPTHTEYLLNKGIAQELAALPPADKKLLQHLILDSFGIDPEEVFTHPVDNLAILQAVFKRKTHIHQ